MKQRILSLSLATLVFFLTGCLKDEKYMAVDQAAPVVEFPIGGPGVVDNGFDVTDITQNLDTSIAINIASPQVLDRDVTVTVQVTPTIVTEFNTNNGTNYTPLPASAFSVENYTLTIPKGYRIGRLKIRLLFPRFDLTNTYALGLQIVNAPGLTISGNFNKFLWSFNLRNKYDGVYRIRGYGFLGANTSAPYLFDVPCGDANEVELTTSGVSSVRMSNQPLFRNGAVFAGFSNVLPEITFNPSSNVVTSVAGYGASTPLSFPNPNTPGYDSRYDPATKTIYLSYGIPLVASWSIRDTLVFCRAR